MSGVVSVRHPMRTIDHLREAVGVMVLDADGYLLHKIFRPHASFKSIAVLVRDGSRYYLALEIGLRRVRPYRKLMKVRTRRRTHTLRPHTLKKVIPHILVFITDWAKFGSNYRQDGSERLSGGRRFRLPHARVFFGTKFKVTTRVSLTQPWANRFTVSMSDEALVRFLRDYIVARKAWRGRESMIKAISGEFITKRVDVIIEPSLLENVFYHYDVWREPMALAYLCDGLPPGVRDVLLLRLWKHSIVSEQTYHLCKNHHQELIGHLKSLLEVSGDTEVLEVRENKKLGYVVFQAFALPLT